MSAAPVELASPDVGQPFDIHAWLTGSGPVDVDRHITSRVRVHLRPELAAQLNDLAARIDEAEGRERSMSEASPAKLTREWQALKAEYDAPESSLWVTVRARLAGEWEQIMQQMERDKVTRTPAEANVYATARFMVEPSLSVAEVREFARRIGGAQFERVIAAWDALSTDAPVVTVPKSLRP